MRGMAFVLTPEARQDIIDIWKYIAEDSVDSADRMLDRLYQGLRRLAEAPAIGHKREDLADERHRFWPIYSYVIVYRWQVRPIQVIAIVHGARFLEAFLAQRLTE